MYQFKVLLTYGTHYVWADDYSVTKGRYVFWKGKQIVRSFPEEDVQDVQKMT